MHGNRNGPDDADDVRAFVQAVPVDDFIRQGLVPVLVAAEDFGLTPDEIERVVRTAAKSAPPDKPFSAVVDALARAIKER